ncbi:MAG TPA: protein translocase subunit SecD [Rudaea sp.]
MNDFPKWKYALIGIVLLLGFLYALPNVFPSVPAVQISANREGKVDEALKEKVLGVLQTKKIDFKDVQLLGDRLLARFANPDLQLQAQDALKSDLGENYIVAPNLASTVPGWLKAIGANAMPLGLDLQGGVHFLMEIDQKAALDKMAQRYVDDIRTALRKANVKYDSVNNGAQGVTITLKSEADRKQAGEVIAKEVNQADKLGAQPPLELIDGPVTGDTYVLIAKVREATLLEQQRGVLTSNLTTLRNRINQLGVAEPLIQQQGANRIVVELPGVQDTAEAKKILGATATLEWHPVDESVTNPYDAEKTGSVPPGSRVYHLSRKGADGKPVPIVLSKKIIAGGDELVDASAQPDPQSGLPAVQVHLNSAGGKKMLDFTTQSVGKRMGVVYIERIPQTRVVDGKEVPAPPKINEEVINAAVIQGVFSTRFQTTGLDSMKTATELALLLRAGSLAAPVDIVEQHVIGPSLGADNIAKGVQAVILGLVAVLLCAAIYYHVFGLIADVGLILNLVLLVAVLSLFQATLTMPGIAGIVLTLGMAIDANVLICERIREELRNGSTPLASIKAGYEKAWATILDANVTHLLAAFGLFAFGSGPIKGFAVTLAIGILTSMFTSVTVTHALVNLVYSGRRKIKGLAVGGGYARGAQ